MRYPMNTLKNRMPISGETFDLDLTFEDNDNMKVRYTMKIKLRMKKVMLY